MTAPYSDMSLYIPCHYLVLSLYSAGIKVRFSKNRGVKKSSMVAECSFEFFEQKLFSAEIVHFNN